MEKYDQRQTQPRNLCQYETCECYKCCVAHPSTTRPSQYYTSHDFPGPTNYHSTNEHPSIARTITFDYPPLSASRERVSSAQPHPNHQKDEYTNRPIGRSTHQQPLSVPRKIPSCKTIEEDPNSEDVLFGRGGGTNRHAGNIYFRKIVSEYQSQYVLAKKLEKAALAQDIVRKIHNQGGKFLKFNEKTSVWHEVTDKDAILKASQALREGAARKLRETWKAVNGIPNPVHYSHSNPLDEDDTLWDLNLSAGLGDN